MNNKDRVDLAVWVMETAIKYGADEAAVSFSNRREIEIEYRDKQLDQVKESVENAIGLSIYIDRKYSGHSTNDLRREALQFFIKEAIQSTKYLSQDEFRILPDPYLYPKSMDRDLKIFDASYEKINSEQRVRIAAEIEMAAMAESNQVISVTSSYSDIVSHSVKVQSNGFLGETKATQFWIGGEATVDDGLGGRPEDWFFAGTRYFQDLPFSQDIGKWAAHRALRKVGQKKIKSGKYTMLVENRCGSRLFGMLRSAMTAYAIQQKQSYLDGMLGKKIASENLTVIDEPFLEKGLGSRLYDGEGIGCMNRILIDRGRLNSFLIDNYYGRKMGWTPNSGSISNILLIYGSKSQDELIQDIHKGIWVTGFIGGNSNSTTGDFSFGITGMLIENGQLVKPVNEMNISGNAKTFWNRLIEVGNDPYPYSAQRLPCMLFEDVVFSGI